MKNIVNFIQFVRGVEPRNPEQDLVTPVVEQIALLKKYNFRGTMLLQYDALLRPDFQKIAREAESFQEVGLWLEMVQPLVEAVGLPWRGRPGFSWDWHSHCDTLAGYAPEERRLLLDKAIEIFREVFGYTPKSVGAWVLDAVSLAHLRDRYGIAAACCCKEQWGTDGYTLWGGNGVAYYPSRKNFFCPAQSKEAQIDVPVFRMLGPDPIYQYDVFLHKEDERTDVVTLEPGSGIFGGKGGGFHAPWVDWYFGEIFGAGRGIGLAYTQTGQENSFSWDAVGTGMPYQSQKIAQLRDRGEVEVLTLGETGEWFSSRYATTPPTAQAALTDWREEGRRSVWYNSARYRANLCVENGEAFIRDCYFFDEEYPERYLSDVCTGESCLFDNLPVWDGLRWAKGHETAKLRFADAAGVPLRVSAAEYAEEGNASVITVHSAQGELRVEFRPEEMRVTSAGFAFCLVGEADPAKIDAAPQPAGEKRMEFTYRGRRYALSAVKGCFTDGAVRSEESELIVSFR